jgi:hypothetical protein
MLLASALQPAGDLGDITLEDTITLATISRFELQVSILLLHFKSFIFLAQMHYCTQASEAIRGQLANVSDTVRSVHDTHTYKYAHIHTRTCTHDRIKGATSSSS